MAGGDVWARQYAEAFDRIGSLIEPQLGGARGAAFSNKIEFAGEVTELAVGTIFEAFAGRKPDTAAVERRAREFYAQRNRAVEVSETDGDVTVSYSFPLSQSKEDVRIVLRNFPAGEMGARRKILAGMAELGERMGLGHALNYAPMGGSGILYGDCQKTQLSLDSAAEEGALVINISSPNQVPYPAVRAFAYCAANGGDYAGIEVPALASKSSRPEVLAATAAVKAQIRDRVARGIREALSPES